MLKKQWLTIVTFILSVTLSVHGGDVGGNGSNPLEYLFGKMRTKAVALVREAPLLNLNPSEEVDMWLLKNHKELAKDIAQSPHQWIRQQNEEGETCAWTLPKLAHEIVFSPTRCKEQGFIFLGDVGIENNEKVLEVLISYLSKEDSSINALINREVELAVLTLIHESVHHLRGSEHSVGSQEESFANLAAERVWSGWYPRLTKTAAVNRDQGIKPLTGKYRSKNKRFVEPITITPFPDGSLVLTGAVKKYYHQEKEPIKLATKEDLPQNIYIHQGDEAHPILGCSYHHYIKMHVISQTEFYLEEYLPNEVYSDNKNRCVVVGYTWRPHVFPYQFSPSGIASEVSLVPLTSQTTKLWINIAAFKAQQKQLFLAGKRVAIPDSGVLSYSLNSSFIGKSYSVKLVLSGDSDEKSREEVLKIQEGYEHRVTFW